MKRIVMALAVALAAPSLPLEAQAQNVTWDYTLVTVDAVAAGSLRLYVTGIPEGGSTPVTAELTYSSYAAAAYDMVASCQRMATLAMERPGLYKLQLSRGSNSGYPYCRVARVTP
jgi:hypothetical protein